MTVYQLKSKVKLSNGVIYRKGCLISAETLALIMREYFWVSVKVKNIY
jgi:hypothetical protein